MHKPIFAKWTNLLRPALGAAAVITPVYIFLIMNYGFDPETVAVGYMPEQPVPYSHALHVGELGLDCRYCHVTVDKPGVGHAMIPPTETCMNCHHQIKKPQADGTASPRLAGIYQSYESGEPIPWVRVHDLGDYCYFNHSAHVIVRAPDPDNPDDHGAGIGCDSCHGRVDLMEEVYQAEELSMAWCLDCHRRPEDHLRPQNEVTNLNYFNELAAAGIDQHERGMQLKTRYNIEPSQDCSTCHR